MSEDYEINFYGLCPRPLVTKGLNIHCCAVARLINRVGFVLDQYGPLVYNDVDHLLQEKPSSYKELTFL